jgi:hypothetical protein
MVIPRVEEDDNVIVDFREENELEEPLVSGVVNVQTVILFKITEKIGPFPSKLPCDITPQLFDPSIVDASERKGMLIHQRQQVWPYIPSPDV